MVELYKLRGQDFIREYTRRMNEKKQQESASTDNGEGSSKHPSTARPKPTPVKKTRVRPRPPVRQSAHDAFIARLLARTYSQRVINSSVQEQLRTSAQQAREREQERTRERAKERAQKKARERAEMGEESTLMQAKRFSPTSFLPLSVHRARRSKQREGAYAESDDEEVEEKEDSEYEDVGESEDDEDEEQHYDSSPSKKRVNAAHQPVSGLQSERQFQGILGRSKRQADKGHWKKGLLIKDNKSV